MRFETLNDMIPSVTGGKKHILMMQPYNGITIRTPGKHSKDTNGGDFVVCVDDERMEWIQHQFSHTDLFTDFEDKANEVPATELLITNYLAVIRGHDPEKMTWDDMEVGIHPQTLLYSVQCLAIAEHRRYSQHEEKWGGRFLPFRFVSGIVEGLWTAAEAADKQRFGRPAVERLEKERGVPKLTKKLMA